MGQGAQQNRKEFDAHYLKEALAWASQLRTFVSARS
jgi:hypothetical protein